MKKQLLRKHALTAILGLSALCSATPLFAQWTPLGTPGFSTGLSNYQHLVIGPGNTPYVSFSDEGLAGAGKGSVMKYDGTNWVSLGAPGFTPGLAQHGSMALGTGNTAYFAFADGSSTGMSRVAVMKYNGTSWSTIGSNLSNSGSQAINIKVAANGTVYVAYIDDIATAGTAVVKSYNGTSWSTLGASTLSPSGAGFTSLALGVNDTPYVAFADNAASQQVSVKKFNGTDWVQVGSSFLAQPVAGASGIQLAFDHNFKPYVAYWNPVPAGPKPTVYKYEGSSWVVVGTASFTTNTIFFPSLAFDNSNTPYLAFHENGLGAGPRASVVKYDGANWVNVGTAGFSPATAAFTSLAIDGNGNPYVAYYDEANGQKTTVMKYTVCTAPTVPAVTASATTICKGDTATLTATGTLNDAAKWYWYTGSCGGILVDSGAVIKVVPGDTITYYVRGLGNCVASGNCTAITVNVDEALKPTITQSGAVLTSSSGTGNQWYQGGNPIGGATSSSYTVTASGWYKVRFTNTNGCSAMSDSVFVVPSSVQQIGGNGDIRIYPAPFTDKLQVRISNNYHNLDQWTLVLTDNTGRKVYARKGLGHENELSLKHLASGMYFIYLDSPASRQALKITKE